MSRPDAETDAFLHWLIGDFLVPTKTPEQKLAAIYQEVGLDKFKAMANLIIALNSPKKEKAKKKAQPVAVA